MLPHRSGEGVFYMLYVCMRPIANYGDDVETHAAVHTVAAKVGVGGGGEVASLPPIDGCHGFCEFCVATCLHFHHDKCLSVGRGCHDVEVTVPDFPVLMADAVTFLSQVVGSDALAPCAQVIMCGHCFCLLCFACKLTKKYRCGKV